MYWPCGVPQVYAYHGRHHDVPENNATIDEDGVEDANFDNTNSNDTPYQNGIVDLCVVRSEQVFATITLNELTLWSTRPTTVLSSSARSTKSIEAYGSNVAIHCRPDGSNMILHTSEGYLLLYSLENDANARVLQQQSQQSQTRKQSIARTFGSNDTTGIAEIVLRFRRAIRIDAGISAVIALDHEMIVATTKPAAVQCIKWDTQKASQHTSTQLLSRMSWNTDKSNIVYMTHNRAMNLSVWLSSEGSAYAVRRLKTQINREVSSDDSSASSNSSTSNSSRLFDGYAFFDGAGSGSQARLAAVNARFSLIALALANGQILCFAAKDYAGNIPLSHKFSTATNLANYGDVHTISWSPDGYCLFVGYAGGWFTWSVFGKEGATSTAGNLSHAQTNSESWLMGVRSANWISNGLEMLLTCAEDNRIWKLEFSRSAAVGCYSCANLVRALQQTPNELAIYRGHELSDLTSISNDASLWHHAQYPVTYLHNQWPVRATVVSQDGRYIAIAGKRGLAHYSVISGRWKAFSDYSVENSFAVRGGFCWFGHILAVATENAQGYDLRLYSRDQELGRMPLHTEAFAMPIAFLGPSGEDSLLVYTYENILYHYIINLTDRGAQLLQVGQIAFHGVVRAPSRVRSVSWVLPEDQLRNGDPSRDVEYAAVLFLIDDKVVLLQPSRTPEDAVKYDMKVIAHQVEYYILMRDQIYFNFNEPIGESTPATPSPGSMMGNIRNQMHYSLRDSLWIFTGERLSMWPEVQDLLTSVTGLSIARQPLLSVPVDFYPLSILLNKGIVLGIESELLQRRDVNFAQFRTLIRTQLFLPYVLRHQLLEANDTPVAFALAHQYQNLSYFPHALEMLLHLVLDAESDRRKSKDKEPDRSEPLPATLSFLQMALSPESYLSTIVQCVRKTEFSYWKYLFAHLPTPETMFEQALALKDLKTASGYLIVLQTFDEEEEDDAKDIENRHRFEQQVVRLMNIAKAENDFELCSELARFMIGIDPAGNALRRVIQKVGFRKGSTHLEPRQSSLSRANIALNDQAAKSVRDLSKLDVRLTRLMVEEPGSAGAESEGIMSRSSGGDYFSASPGEL